VKKSVENGHLDAAKGERDKIREEAQAVQALFEEAQQLIQQSFKHTLEEIGQDPKIAHEDVLQEAKRLEKQTVEDAAGVKKTFEAIEQAASQVWVLLRNSNKDIGDQK
jgi:hypothetical protein